MKADTLKDINAKKVKVQEKLEHIKKEIKDINLKHSEEPFEAEGTNAEK
jgi:hypothetical protein